MRYLVLEASAAAASCALLENQKVLGEFFVNIPQTHSQTLLPMAQGLLDTCGVPAGAVDFFAVPHGPGSFTGLRIAMAAVKGLAMAAEKPCVGVSTLEALARNLAGFAGQIIFFFKGNPPVKVQHGNDNDKRNYNEQPRCILKQSPCGSPIFQIVQGKNIRNNHFILPS